VNGTPVSFMATDGRALGGTLFRPAGPPSMALLINGAMGVPHRFYGRFAAWLAEQGALVLTYDYRGVGASRGPRLRDDPTTLLDWARLDQPAAIATLRAAAPGCPWCLIGHSVGGQIAGLSPEPAQAAGIVFVAAQSGALRHWRGLPWVRVAALWFVLIPSLTRLLGYLPGRRLGLGEDLPPGVVRQWAQWGRTDDYLLSELGDAGRAGWAALSGRRVAVRFTDDPIAPEAAVEALLAWMPQAHLTRVVVDPAQLGHPIGHFGYFKPDVGGALWPNLWAELQAATRAT